MNHIQLHNELSDVFQQLKNGKINPQHARQMFYGASKLIQNSKNALYAIAMGLPCDVPLLDLKKEDIPKKTNQLHEHNEFHYET